MTSWWSYDGLAR